MNEIIDIKMFNFNQGLDLEWEELIAEISPELWNSLLEFKDSDESVRK